MFSIIREALVLMQTDFYKHTKKIYFKFDMEIRSRRTISNFEFDSGTNFLLLVPEP